MKDYAHVTSNSRNGLHKSNRNAFTLVELLAVIAIMGILMGLILGISGLVWRVAKESKAKSHIEKIGSALQEYMLQNGSYPGLNGAVHDTSVDHNFVNSLTNWLTIATNGIITDPWGNGYQYIRRSAQSFTLYSKGADGKDRNDPGGTVNDNDNIQSGR